MAIYPCGVMPIISVATPSVWQVSKEGHSCNWMIYFADDRIALFAQYTGDPVEITHRQVECNMLCPTCGIPGEIIMEHALAGNGLDEFDEGSTIMGLGSQPFAGHGLAIIDRTQFPGADVFRLGKPATRREFVRKFTAA